MSATIIRVENLGKRYSLRHQTGERYTALRDIITNRASSLFRRTSNKHSSNGEAVQAAREDFWALKGVSFEVKQGEVLGIIGRNGAGKSTLLKILSRITDPTEGRIKIKGRVASLLEVGTGFHPELTGRENIYLNGAILGMHRSEIKAKFDEIVAFAEVEKFLDTPVKRYSSGMYVRLAFAVAAHLEPEILIVDEVLAVGDAEFQKKCLGKMQEVSLGGRTVLFVSHNMSAVMNLCARAFLLTAGRLAVHGETADVVNRYLSTRDRTAGFSPRVGERSGDQRVRIEDFAVEPENPQTGQLVRFVFKLLRRADLEHDLDVQLAVSVLTEQGMRVLQLFSQDMGRSFCVSRDTCEIEMTVDALPLMPGNYWLNLWAGAGTTPYDWIREGYYLNVAPGRFIEGGFVNDRGYPVVIRSRWQICKGAFS